MPADPASLVSPVPPLVDADWLAARLDSVIVLDLRPLAAFIGGHVPGAVQSDYLTAGWRVEIGGIPGMLPPPPQAEALIGGLGIGNDDAVVVMTAGTDASDFAGAARVYWTLRVLGHDRASVLDGGYGAWRDGARRPVETGPVPPRAPAVFTARPRPALLADAAAVAAAAAAGLPVVDTRAADYFIGKAKSPAARVAGTVPGAVNLAPDLFYRDGRLTTGEALARLAHQAGAGGPVITLCNTGHLASLSWFALSEVAGLPDIRLYDGSMADWTSDPARPIG